MKAKPMRGKSKEQICIEEVCKYIGHIWDSEVKAFKGNRGTPRYYALSENIVKAVMEIECVDREAGGEIEVGDWRRVMDRGTEFKVGAYYVVRFSDRIKYGEVKEGGKLVVKDMFDLGEIEEIEAALRIGKKEEVQIKLL